MTMPELTASQVDAYHRDGFLLLDDLRLDGAVMDRLTAATSEILTAEGPEVVLERDASTVRSVYGPHRSNETVAELVRRDALLQPVRQLIGDQVYVHQSKLNVKAAFSGDQWEWHQDYINWLRLDGIRDPGLVNVAVFLDPVTEYNGPLMFIPGSHRDGLLPGSDRFSMPVGYEEAPSWVATLTADEQFEVDRDTIRKLAERDGMYSAKGAAGSVLLFHSSVLHASLPNISPFDRRVLLLVYNRVENAPGEVAKPRPWFLAERPPVCVTT
jgi:ectoine hydroxylase